jgi:hypothetical protein
MAIREILPQYGGFNWAPKKLMGHLPDKSYLLLTHFLDLEYRKGNGFYHTVLQIQGIFKWNKKTVESAIKFLTEAGIVHSESGGPNNKNRYFIIEENLIDWLENPEMCKVKMKKSRVKNGSTLSDFSDDIENESRVENDPTDRVENNPIKKEYLDKNTRDRTCVTHTERTYVHEAGTREPNFKPNNDSIHFVNPNQFLTSLYEGI